MIDSVDLLLVPVGENLRHHLLTRIGILAEGLLDDNSVGLFLGVVVLLEHLRDVDELGGRESELLFFDKEMKRGGSVSKAASQSWRA